MYHPNSLRVRQVERLWGRRKEAIEQPNLLKMVKTALFHPTDTTMCIESSQNLSCQCSLVQAGPIQNRLCLTPPPPPSEALNSTTFNYLTELAKHSRNKWLTTIKNQVSPRNEKADKPKDSCTLTWWYWSISTSSESDISIKLRAAETPMGSREPSKHTRARYRAPSGGTNKGNLQPLYVEILLHYVVCTIKCPYTDNQN